MKATFSDLDTRFLYRIPGRDYRKEITHKLPSDMNRAERRLVDSDIRKNPRDYGLRDEVTS